MPELIMFEDGSGMVAVSASNPVPVGSQSDPATHAAVVTPDDDADLANAARALFIGGAGDLKVTTTGGETVAFVGLTGGIILPVAVSRVFATGQAGAIASNIVALY